MPENAWNLTYTNVMGLCALAYKDYSPNGSGKTYRVGHSNWQITSIDNLGGFRSVTVVGKDINNNFVKIVVFSGSDDLKDWGLKGNAGDALLGAKNTKQYNHGVWVAENEKPNYVLGHSLGGGIALYSSLKLSIRAVTINPAPVIDYGIFKINSWDDYPWAINYCVNYEMLAAGRGIFSSKESPGKRISVETSADPLSPVARHKLPYLAGFIAPIEKK